MTLGEKVLAVRSAAKMTAVQLAEKANITQAMVSRIERNRRMPSLVLLSDIAAACGVTLDELLKDVDL